MVDLVMPYVNNKDKVWRKTYIDYCKSHKEYAYKLESIDGERFRDNNNLFELNLQFIRACLPFIHKFYLIVSNIEQVDGLDLTGVEVVLHEQIMPKEILPTFNSSTIEMFIGNIPNLAERFIYINDDMIPLRVMQESDFFTEDGKVRMQIYSQHETTNTSLFRQMVINQYREVFKGTDDYLGDDYYLRPEHSATPMLKSVVLETIEKYKDSIWAHLEAFRNEFQHQQYLYIYEMLKRDLVADSDLRFIYFKLRDKYILNHCYMICDKNGSHYHWLCFNDDIEDNGINDLETRQKVFKRALMLCLTYLKEKGGTN